MWTTLCLDRKGILLLRDSDMFFALHMQVFSVSMEQVTHLVVFGIPLWRQAMNRALFTLVAA